MKFFKKYFIIFLIIFCCVISISSFNRNSFSFIEKSFGNFISPLQKATSNINLWLSSKIKIISNLNHIKILEEELDLLKIESDIKSQEIKRLKYLEIENEKLSNLLQTSSKYSEYSKVVANVIARDPGNWYENFTIDKGSKDGIKKNMVVLSINGLVGKVEEVGSNFAKVSSIINGTYSVSAKSARTSDEGFVKGDLSKKGICKMEYIDKEAEIKEGDEIITSHLSEIYPAGITIGTVKEIFLDNSNKLSKTAIIEPAVDFKHIEKVLIITNQKK